MTHRLVPRSFLGGGMNTLCGNESLDMNIDNFRAMQASYDDAIKTPVSRVVTCLRCAAGQDYVARGN